MPDNIYDKIIVTDFTNLRKKLGIENIIKIDDLLQIWAKSDRLRGLETIVVYLDLSPELNDDKIEHWETAVQLDYVKAIDTAYKVYTKPGKQNYIIIYGDDEIIPFQGGITFEDPKTGSQTAMGDSTYSVDCMNLRDPQSRFVSRIPTGCTLELSENILKNFITYNKQYPQHLLPSFDEIRDWITLYDDPSRTDNQLVLEIKNKIIASISNSKKYSMCKFTQTNLKFTPLDLENASKSNFHLHLLHGAKGDTKLYGGIQPDLSDCFDVSILDQLPLGNFAVFLSCYSGNLSSTGTPPKPNIVSLYLSKGATCVLASTNYIYINHAESEYNAYNFIPIEFLKNLKQGFSFGTAYNNIIMQYKKNQQIGILEKFTVGSFVLYGDCSITPLKSNPVKKTGWSKRYSYEFETPSFDIHDDGRWNQPDFMGSEGFFVGNPQEIPKGIKKIIDSYLLVNYKVEKATSYSCYNVSDPHQINEDCWEYIAYVKTPLEKPKGAKEQTFNEAWYSFIGDQEKAEFQGKYVLS